MTVILGKALVSNMYESMATAKCVAYVSVFRQCSHTFLYDLGSRCHQILPRSAHVTSASEEDLPQCSLNLKTCRSEKGTTSTISLWFVPMFSHP